MTRIQFSHLLHLRMALRIEIGDMFYSIYLRNIVIHIIIIITCDKYGINMLYKYILICKNYVYDMFMYITYNILQSQ